MSDYAINEDRETALRQRIERITSRGTIIGMGSIGFSLLISGFIPNVLTSVVPSAAWFSSFGSSLAGLVMAVGAISLSVLLFVKLSAERELRDLIARD